MGASILWEMQSLWLPRTQMEIVDSAKKWPSGYNSKTENANVTMQFLVAAEIEYVLSAVMEKLIAKNDDCDEHLSKEHDENAEYFHDLYGDVIAFEEEELVDKADDAEETVPKIAVGEWTLVVKRYGRVSKVVK